MTLQLTTHTLHSLVNLTGDLPGYRLSVACPRVAASQRGMSLTVQDILLSILLRPADVPRSQESDLLIGDSLVVEQVQKGQSDQEVHTWAYKVVLQTYDFPEKRRFEPVQEDEDFQDLHREDVNVKESDHEADQEYSQVISHAQSSMQEAVSLPLNKEEEVNEEEDQHIDLHSHYEKL